MYFFAFVKILNFISKYLKFIVKNTGNFKIYIKDIKNFKNFDNRFKKKNSIKIFSVILKNPVKIPQI